MLEYNKNHKWIETSQSFSMDIISKQMHPFKSKVTPAPKPNHPPKKNYTLEG